MINGGYHHRLKNGTKPRDWYLVTDEHLTSTTSLMGATDSIAICLPLAGDGRLNDMVSNRRLLALVTAEDLNVGDGIYKPS